MMDFINQYLPELATVGAIVVPMVPLLIKRTVNDKNLVEKVTEVKIVAEKLSNKEALLTKEVQSITNTTQNIKVEVDRMKKGVDEEMKKVSEQLLGFQEGDLYQKMLNGLGSLDKIEQTIENQKALIESQAATIKEMRKKLG
jgi:hypothetical protein